MMISNVEKPKTHLTVQRWWVSEFPFSNPKQIKTGMTIMLDIYLVKSIVKGPFMWRFRRREWVEIKRFLGLPVHPTSAIFFSLCEARSVLKSDVTTAVKRQNIEIYNYSYRRYIGKHMATAKLQVGCVQSCRQSSYRNNAHKMKKKKKKM